MRITDYDLYRVPPRWLFLRVETDTGIVGWGEPVIEGRARTVATAVEELFEAHLLGSDPLQIEDHWQEMYRGGFYRGGPILMSAIAGVDQALWDIKGKHYNIPVYELLGGTVRDRIRVYQWIGGDEPSEVAEAAAEQVDAGFTALKMNATGALRRIDTQSTIQEARTRLDSVREAVGPEIDIGVDFHGRATKSMAARLANAIEDAHPMFIEEPVLPEHNEHLPALANRTDIPIATGERMFSRWDFKHILEDGAVDIIQPDLSHAGGISEVRKIAAMAESYDVAVAPHCPLGPIALASCVQLDACTPNFLIQEQSLDMHYNVESDVLDYLQNPSVFEYEDGYVKTPTGPGLGIEPDLAVIQERSGHDEWRSPVWRTDDGTVTEW